MTDPMNVEHWTVPAIGPGSLTLVSGRDFVISDNWGDMVRGAVHGLLHDDRRFLDVWVLSVEGCELRPLATATPTPFSAVFVARVHELSGRPLPLIVVRRRSVGRGMREVIEIHNSGPERYDLEVRCEIGADFGHLFDVKSGRPTTALGSLRATDHGLLIEESHDGHRCTRLASCPGPSAVRAGGCSWRLGLPPRGHRGVRVTVEPVTTDDDGGGRAAIDARAVDELAHHRYEMWQQLIPQVVSPDPRLSVAVEKSLEDLASLRIFDTAHPELTVVAAGAPWYMTLFGRDSLLTSYMALPFAPWLVRGVLHELAELQGRTVDPSSGEEPGKILHELRTRGAPGPFSTRARYYGTVDATPLYVLVAAEAARWGAVSTADRAWLVPAVDAAMRWIREHGDRNDDGFVDYAPQGGQGLVNQGWKDSHDGVTFADGRLPDPPISLVEVQGYTYAALLGAADIYRAVGRHDDAARCRHDAQSLRESFNRTYWDERGWFVEALDGTGRRVDSLGSNPGHALWTGIADPDHAHRFLDILAGDEMWSGWGVRTLSTSMGAYDPLSYHNGSVWPHDTAICLAGAARYGRWDVVDRLTDGLLDASTRFGGRLPELFAGLSRDVIPVPVPYPGSCIPQAWAAASILLVLRANLGLDVDVRQRRITVTPVGRLVDDIDLKNLPIGEWFVSINITDGELTSRADGLDVLDTRGRSPERDR